MSVEVSLARLFDDLERWGPAYLLTVSDDQRPHLLALWPSADLDRRTLRFETGGGRASRNAIARPAVTVLFPPAVHSDGMSLVVDGTATVEGDVVEVAPTRAVLHRAAPGL